MGKTLNNIAGFTPFTGFGAIGGGGFAGMLKRSTGVGTPFQYTDPFDAGGSGDGVAPGAAGDTTAEMSRRIFNQTQPLRDETTSQLLDFLKGGTPAFLAGPTTAQEQSLQAARQGIIGTGARGGQLNRSLMELPVRRLIGREQLRSQFFSPAADLAFRGAQTGISGTGQAEGLAFQNQQLQVQQDMAQQQSLGNLLGLGLGLGLKGGGKGFGAAK